MVIIMNNLALIVMDNIYELGNSVDKKLMKLNNSKSFIIDTKSYRFNNGEGKFKIFESIYILSDVGNYSLTYKMHGQNVIIGPDEHFQDIKRCISALSGYAKSINIVMPLLYQSRQDERNSLESLDCSLALHELENLGVKKIITFDVHDKGVFNSVVNLSIENYYPTNLFLPSILKNKDSNFLVVDAVQYFIKNRIIFAPGKAANAGGVAVSGLEMSQNSMKLNWSAEEVDSKLKGIMTNIHAACVKEGKESDGYINYVKGANIAGFKKVADTMVDLGY